MCTSKEHRGVLSSHEDVAASDPAFSPVSGSVAGSILAKDKDLGGAVRWGLHTLWSGDLTHTSVGPLAESCGALGVDNVHLAESERGVIIRRQWSVMTSMFLARSQVKAAFPRGKWDCNGSYTRLASQSFAFLSLPYFYLVYLHQYICTWAFVLYRV